MGYLDDLAISSHAYYAGERWSGLRACERILATNCGPICDEERVRRNRTWYTPTLREVVGSATTKRLMVDPAKPGWTTFNPSVAPDGDGLLGIVRSSNYHVIDGAYVYPPEDEGRIKTRNIVVRLTADGDVLSQMDLLGPGYETSDFPIEGMEDLRLFRWPGWSCGVEGGVWRVSGTVCDTPGSNGDRRMAVATLLPDAGILCDFSCPEPPFPGRHEKNWQPFGAMDMWIYSNWEDGVTQRISRPVAKPSDVWFLHHRTQSRPAPWISRGFRGGSQVIPWKNGSLSVIHEVAHIGHKRAYEHRFVKYDDRLEIVAVSQPFIFQRRRGIEFCAGAAVVGDRLVMSFGDDDETAWLAFCGVDDVDRCLQTIGVSGPTGPRG
jgi:hypothetical protein